VWYVPDAVVIHEESSSFTDRDLRLRLAHRNRLIFALPRLAEARSGDEFLAAEVAHLAAQAHRDEVRAVSGAALDVLTVLPTALRCRLGEDAPDGPAARRLRRLLVALRDACRDVLMAPPHRSG
jgi:hypothetical protein